MPRVEGSAPSSGSGSTDERTVALAPAADADVSASSGPEKSHRSLTGTILRGRYAVLEALGAGAMGVVWRAYDSKLCREVALKHVQGDRLRGESHRRLVREAQAMAQLTHTNVVAVYDVDDAPDESSDRSRQTVLIAMEYVPGTTLRTWLREQTRTSADILAVFRQAGEGLAAAHRVDLVHRDFKPANVLVTQGPTGPIAKVGDFGLAKASRSPDSLSLGGSSESSTQRSLESLDDLGSPLTEDDVVMGTPRYMAPEQHAGAPADPSADQYAFCVALWEALVGEPPFSGKDGIKAKFRGPPAWPRAAAVPRPIADAITRGLSVDPKARWPSMPALLAALAHDPGRRRRRWALVGGSVAVVAITFGGVAAAYAERGRRCGGGPSRMGEVWNEDGRARIFHAMQATDLVYAGDTAERVVSSIDAFAEAWMAQHRETCEATAIRQEQSAEVMDLRMGCLERARTDLRATVDVLAAANDTIVEKGVELVEGLPTLAHCEDVEALRSREPSPADAETARAVDDARAELAEVHASARVGRYDEALELADRLVTRATEIGHPPLIVEAVRARADALQDLGRYDDAEVAAREALERALAIPMRRTAADIASFLVYLVGHSQSRPAEARWLASVALSMAQAEGAGTELEAEARSSVAAALLSDGHLEEAREHLELALEIRQRLFGERDSRVARSMHALGVNAADRGDYDAAEDYLRRALEVRIEAMGENHPSIGYTLNSLSNLLRIKGELEEGLALAEHALAVRQKALPANHPAIGATLNNIGLIHYMNGDYEAAAEWNRRALEVREAAHGPEHPEVADSHNNIGVALNALGRYAESAQAHERALEIREKLLGPEHPAIAMSLTNLGVAVRHLGRLEDAEAFNRRALEINEKRLGPDHAEVANALDNLGNAFLEQGKYEEARAQYVRSVEVRSKALGPEHAEVARSRSNLGTVLTAMQRFDEAEKELRAAAEIWEKARGPDYADLAFAWQGLGELLEARRDLDGAITAYRRALGVRERALEPDHPLVAVPASSLGLLLAQRGELADAKRHLERALEILTRSDESPVLQGRIALALADVLWRLGRDRQRARALAEQALNAGRPDAHEDGATVVAEAERWLARHPLRAP
jgi:eukaryotic-like serine/threonine-protein kinase